MYRYKVNEMSSQKCANPDCNHRTIKKDQPLCSLCRQNKPEKHKCALEGCDVMCVTEFCRHHAHKVVQCSFVTQYGVRCTKTCRKDVCGNHTPKMIEWRKKWKEEHPQKNYNVYDPVKAKIRGREKRIKQLEEELVELKASHPKYNKDIVVK